MIWHDQIAYILLDEKKASNDNLDEKANLIENLYLEFYSN